MDEDESTRGFKRMKSNELILPTLRANGELDGRKSVGIVIVPTENSSDTPELSPPTIAERLCTSRIVIQPYTPARQGAAKGPNASPGPRKQPKLFQGEGQMDFYQLICTESSCLKHFKSVGLLQGGRVNGYCQNVKEGHLCGALLEEHTDTNIKKYEFIKDVKCSNEECGSIGPANKLLSYADIYNPNRLSLSRIMELIWMWCHLYSKPMAEQLSVQSSCTVREWFKYCQEICDLQFEQRKPMGGLLGVVHVDEYLCSDKSSNPESLDESCSETVGESKNYGNRLFGPWVFVLSWKNGVHTFETRYFIVERRDAETLLTIIKAEVQQGSQIHCDHWLAYESLANHGYFVSIYEQTIFQDQETGRRTRAIERLSEYVKRKKFDLKCENTRNAFNLLLREEWWRSRNTSHTFNRFLSLLKQVYCSRKAIVNSSVT